MIAKLFFRILKLKPLTHNLYVFYDISSKLDPVKWRAEIHFFFLCVLYVFAKISKNCNGYGNIRLNNSIQYIHFENVPTDLSSAKVHLS